MSVISGFYRLGEVGRDVVERLPGLPFLRTHRRRRVMAAVALAVATTLIVWALIPQTTGTKVTVAAHDIHIGERIEADDVTQRTFPRELIPAHAIADVHRAVGAQASAPLSAGMPVTTTALLSHQVKNLPPGKVLMPVTIGDEAASSIVRPGLKVRIYSSVAAGGLGATAAGGVAGTATGEISKTVDSQVSAPGQNGSTEATKALVDSAVVANVDKKDSAGLTGSKATIATLIVTDSQAAALATVAGTQLSFALLE